MPQYRYTALSRNGETLRGVVQGFHKLDAIARVRENGAVPLRVEEVREQTGLWRVLHMELGGERLDKNALAVMCGQFSTILRSGMPVVRTVRLVAEKTRNRTLRALLRQIEDDVEAGRPLSAAFEDRGRTLLPPAFVETLRSGEETGNLDQSFEALRRYLGKQADVDRKVRSAMAYPLFVLAVAAVVLLLMMTVVVPRLLRVFRELDAELPLLTRILLGALDFLGRYGLFLAVAVIAAVLLALVCGHTKKGCPRMGKLALKLPVLGRIVELNAVSQFARSMAMLLNAGITVDRAVAISAKTMDNDYLAEEAGGLANLLEEGRTLSASMREQGALPDILVDMTALGEETGELAGTMHTIALYYETELQTEMERALAGLEPALLLGLAAVAGFLVLSIYLSMFSIYSAI